MEGGLSPVAGDFNPEFGLLNDLEDRGNVLVFLGVAKPDEESLDLVFLTPVLIGDWLALLRAPGIPLPTGLSPEFCRERDSLVDLGAALGLLRGKVP